MKTLLKIWLFAIILYAVGAASMLFRIWPAPDLLSIYEYAFDNRYETASLGERVRNDLNITPYRLLSRDAGGAPKGDGYQTFDIPNLAERRQQPHLFMSPDRKPRLTFIYGVFDFTDGLHGAILIDENGKYVRRWTLAENPEASSSQPHFRVYPHGVQVAPDGSVTFIFDFGKSINKVDACGAYLWSRTEPRGYNHALSKDGDGNLWTLAGNPSWFDKIDPKTGDILQSISMEDVITANPDLGIFSTRAAHSSNGRQWLDDPFHGNDVEPLLPDMAAAFPMFDAGDLLISFRALNLVFVIDPVTLKVKWWQQGLTQQQHDPDWMPDGTIMVFDNRWDNPPSRLIKINPASNTVTTVLDGEKYDFFTADRGKAQEFEGDFIVTSSKQGRVFEVDSAGRLVFDFINTYDDQEGLRALVSEAIALPVDYFKDMPKCD